MGDGINDVFVFVGVDVGVVIGIGIDVVVEIVDVILLGGDLCSVLNVVVFSCVVICNIKFNLFWVFVYNVLLILVVVGVFVFWGLGFLLVLVVVVMGLSSVFVMSNVLWLCGFMLFLFVKG